MTLKARTKLIKVRSDARVPIHHGLRGYGNYLSKTAGVVTWPAAGIVIYCLDIGVFAEDLATHYRGTGVPLLFLSAVLSSSSPYK